MAATAEPLATGIFRAPRGAAFVFEELEEVTGKLLATFRPGPMTLQDRIEASKKPPPPRSALLRSAVLLAAELAAVPALRAVADALDFVIKTYRTPAGERTANPKRP